MDQTDTVFPNKSSSNSKIQDMIYKGRHSLCQEQVLSVIIGKTEHLSASGHLLGGRGFPEALHQSPTQPDNDTMLSMQRCVWYARVSLRLSFYSVNVLLVFFMKTIWSISNEAMISKNKKSHPHWRFYTMLFLKYLYY